MFTPGACGRPVRQARKSRAIYKSARGVWCFGGLRLCHPSNTMLIYLFLSILFIVSLHSSMILVLQRARADVWADDEKLKTWKRNL